MTSGLSVFKIHVGRAFVPINFSGKSARPA